MEPKENTLSSIIGGGNLCIHPNNEPTELCYGKELLGPLKIRNKLGDLDFRTLCSRVKRKTWGDKPETTRRENQFSPWSLGLTPELFSSPNDSGITELDQGIGEFNWKHVGQSLCADDSLLVFPEKTSVVLQLKRCQWNSIQKPPGKINFDEFTLEFTRIHPEI